MCYSEKQENDFKITELAAKRGMGRLGSKGTWNLLIPEIQRSKG